MLVNIYLGFFVTRLLSMLISLNNIIKLFNIMLLVVIMQRTDCLLQINIVINIH